MHYKCIPKPPREFYDLAPILSWCNKDVTVALCQKLWLNSSIYPIHAQLPIYKAFY